MSDLAFLSGYPSHLPRRYNETRASATGSKDILLWLLARLGRFYFRFYNSYPLVIGGGSRWPEP
jgi:hypothetical protein